MVAKDLKRLHADSEDSDQTARMRRLIRVFAGRTCNIVGNAVPRLKLHFDAAAWLCCPTLSQRLNNKKIILQRGLGYKRYVQVNEAIHNWRV